MELRQLRYAVRVAQTRHFGRAAELEHIAPSVLSTQIRRLEIELGVTLFERSPHRVRVTPAGAHFLQEAGAILDSLTALQSETRTIARGGDSRLSIGYFGEALGELTHLLFDAFTEAHPDTRLSFTELFMNNQLEALHSRQVDVAFVRLPVEDPLLEVTPLYQEPMHAAVSARGAFAGEARLHIEDIIDQPFAVAAGGTPSSWSGYWSLDEQRGERSRIGAEVTTVSESFSAVAYSDTIDTVPASAARTIRHPGVSFVPIDDAGPTALAFVRRRDNTNPMVDALRECATGLVRRRLTLMPGAEPLI
ncbi:MAG: LysR family transcriptional regulator [Leucobacter sp.]